MLVTNMPRHPMTLRRVVFDIAGTERVTIRRDLEYRGADEGPLTFDLYRPSGLADEPTPLVIFVSGYSDIGARKILGCAFKEMESTRSWGRLAAASGIGAIAYSTGRDPASDIRSLLDHVGTHASVLNIDPTRIAIWACSGHVPNALSILIDRGRAGFACAVLCYGYMLDANGSTAVSDAARTFRFVIPASGKSIDDLPDAVPLLLVRAGRDETPGLNETLDRFIAGALRRNLPVTVVNHHGAPHAFDLVDDSAATRRVVRRILGFMRDHLLAPA